MYRYEYVPLKIGGSFLMGNRDYAHRTVIGKYAAQGWRYVGYVPSEFTGNGGTREIDLIFEREEPDD